MKTNIKIGFRNQRIVKGVDKENLLLLLFFGIRKIRKRVVKVYDILRSAIERNTSDIHITENQLGWLRIQGNLERYLPLLVLQLFHPFVMQEKSIHHFLSLYQLQPCFFPWQYQNEKPFSGRLQNRKCNNGKYKFFCGHKITSLF